eukprot:TRINITY_DN5725_c0_g1_i10.p1 TRINITY_DN5725_c0_g1~~TRINITY_DN5725_c0_g1_i10.p1  ORF type:complete len:1003 (-),score=271.71 TRINITY_DN5725_c0_g1_i10:834-3842(-)
MDTSNSTNYSYSRELQSCTSMGVNCSGDLALLAGRRVLGLVNLDSPAQLYAREPRQSKWDVLTCQWSNLDEYKTAIASNNKVEILSVRDREICIETSLRAHTRVISDLAWHTHSREILATSSTDAYIYLWDLRDPRRPKLALQAVAGAAKVKWNKVSGKYLATAHEGEVKLWDTRTSKSPVQYINAHLSRIYDMDWSPDDENHLVTTGQDLTVKYWNISNPNKSENVIRVQTTPVWRLCHTPFGHGLITLGMQSVVRGQNSLTLWNNNNLVGPVHTFKVPDIILDMAWRQWPDSSRCALITWSKDYTLRFWNMDIELQQKCGHVVEDLEIERAEDFEPNVIDTSQPCDIQRSHSFFEIEEEETVVIASPHSRGQSIPPMIEGSLPRGYGSSSSFSQSVSDRPMNLNYEFSLINLSDKLTIEVANADERLFTVSAKTRRNQLVLNAKFPLNYPNQVPPTFSFLEGTTIDNVSRNNILQRMKNVAKQHISKNRRCLEACMRQFEQSVDSLSLGEGDQQTSVASATTVPTQQPFYREITDHNVPYPRSSGARFCGDGHLVCFGLTRQYVMKVGTAAQGGEQVKREKDTTNKSSTDLAKTPRTLSAFYSKMCVLASGSTSPKYAGMKVVSLMDSNSSHQDFALKSRVSRVRFNTMKTRNLSISSLDDPQITHTTLEKRKKTAAAHKQRRQLEAKVTVYNCSSLMSYSKPLALKLIVPASAEAEHLSLSQVCTYNAKVAEEHDRPDLEQIWRLASVVANAQKCHKDTLNPWAANPCGRSLLTKLINHHIQCKDVQTAALLICVFGNKDDITPKVRKNNSKSESLQMERESAFGALTLGTTGKHNRSNSDTQSEESDFSAVYGLGPASQNKVDEEEQEQLEEDMKLLDPKLNASYNNIVEFYGDLLYRWKLMEKRTEVMKQTSGMRQRDLYTSNITFFCPTCGKVMRGPWCSQCRALPLTCCVCRAPCRGLISLCPSCGHGGHAQHLRTWFQTELNCPTACGCQCPLK